MSFPERKYSDIGTYYGDYFDRLRVAAESVDSGRLAEAAKILDLAFRRDATLYVCGNGGSAAICDSFVCDHSKLIQTDTNLNVRVVSLSASMAMITAIANDISYDDIFVYQLKTLGRQGDVLLTVSASGNSENVVRAATWARNNGMHVISLTGFNGGRTAEIAEVNLHVSGDNYGVIEDTHQSLMHVLAQYIRQAHMKNELVADRLF